MRSSFFRLLAPASLLLGACSDSTEPPPPTEVSCRPADAASGTVPLAAFQGRTFRGSELSRCAWVTGSGARYLVVPQFATETATRSLVRYALSNGGSTATTARAAGSQTVSAAAQLDNALRQIEHRLAGHVARDASELRALRLSTQAVRGPSFQVVGSTRQFKVLSAIPANNQQQLTFANVTATLRFAGQNILIYVDQLAPWGPNGF